MIFNRGRRVEGMVRRTVGGMAMAVVNEYKFVVDFQGLMYFDDSQTHKNPKNLIKDRKFVEKFYLSLRENEDGLKGKYRYVGEFWGEKNYLRFSTAPIIYTAINQDFLEFSLGLTTPFQPSNLFLDQDQHLCYPFQTSHTTLKGIFSNQLSSFLLPHFSHSDNKTILSYQGKDYHLPTL